MDPNLRPCVGPKAPFFAAAGRIIKAVLSLRPPSLLIMTSLACDSLYFQVRASFQPPGIFGVLPFCWVPGDFLYVCFDSIRNSAAFSLALVGSRDSWSWPFLWNYGVCRISLRNSWDWRIRGIGGFQGCLGLALLADLPRWRISGASGLGSIGWLAAVVVLVGGFALPQGLLGRLRFL